MKKRVVIGKTVLANPIIAASGTFGYGKEASRFFDISMLGGFVTKTITPEPREGNLPPRIYDVGYGVVNSIGLENQGLAHFKKTCIPFLRTVKTNVFVSLYGSTHKEWDTLIDALRAAPVEGFELNFSCPNLKGEIASGSARAVKNIVKRARARTKKTIIAKLSYSLNVISVAHSAQDAGADAVTLINTVPTIVWDGKSAKPILGNATGGLSGPCIKPIALKAVHEVAQKTRIPIIGCGGIMEYRDVLEFLSLGARAVQVGTANLIDPCACKKIIQEFNRHYGKKN